MKRRTLISLGLGSCALAAVGKPLIARSLNADLLNADSSSADRLSADCEPLRFAAIGDVGTAEMGQYKVAKAMARRWQSSPFPMVMMTGDNIYPNGDIGKVSEAFEQPYAPLLEEGVTFYASLGNHDFRTDRGRGEIAYDGYNMPSRYYSFRKSFCKQSAQFFALDTNLAYIQNELGASAWQSQLRWLRAALARSRSPWKIVFAHHPVYSSGKHGSSNKLISELSPIFKLYGVQLYINGHDHNYERTEPIEGTTYITSGNGAKLRPVGSSKWTAHASSQLGFATFEVHLDRVVIRAIDANNQVYDEAVVAAS